MPGLFDILISSMSNPILNLGSIILALIGLFLIYYREKIERRMRRNSLNQVLLNSPQIQELEKNLTKDIISGSDWNKFWDWRKNEFENKYKLLFTSLGIATSILISSESFQSTDVFVNLFASSYVLVTFLLLLSALIFISSGIPKRGFILSLILRYYLAGPVSLIVLATIYISTVIASAVPQEPGQNFDPDVLLVIFILISGLIIGYITLFISKQIERDSLAKHYIENPKQKILSNISVYLEGGKELNGDLYNFYDPNLVTIIEEEGSKTYIFWNKVEGVRI